MKEQLGGDRVVDPDQMQPYLSHQGPEQPGALLKRVQEQETRRAKIDALCEGSTTILVEDGPDQHPMRVTLIPLGSILSQYRGESLLFVIRRLGVTLGCSECAKLGVKHTDEDRSESTHFVVTPSDEYRCPDITRKCQDAAEGWRERKPGFNGRVHWSQIRTERTKETSIVNGRETTQITWCDLGAHHLYPFAGELHGSGRLHLRYVNGSASGQSNLSGQDLFTLYKWLRTNLCMGQATCEDESRVGELWLRVIRAVAGKGSIYQGWDCKLAHGLGNPYPVLWHTLASTYLQNILLKDVVAGLYDEWKKPDEEFIAIHKRNKLSSTLPPTMCTLVNQLLNHSLSHSQEVTVPSRERWFSPFGDTGNKEVVKIEYKRKTVTLPGRQVHGGVSEEMAKQAAKDLLYLQKTLFKRPEGEGKYTMAQVTWVMRYLENPSAYPCSNAPITPRALLKAALQVLYENTFMVTEDPNNNPFIPETDLVAAAPNAASPESYVSSQARLSPTNSGHLTHSNEQLPGAAGSGSCNCTALCSGHDAAGPSAAPNPQQQPAQPHVPYAQLPAEIQLLLDRSEAGPSGRPARVAARAQPPAPAPGAESRSKRHAGPAEPARPPFLPVGRATASASTRAANKPATKPGNKPANKPTAKPSAKPGNKPGTKPGANLSTKPSTSVTAYVDLPGPSAAHLTRLAQSDAEQPPGAEVPPAAVQPGAEVPAFLAQSAAAPAAALPSHPVPQPAARRLRAGSTSQAAATCAPAAQWSEQQVRAFITPFGAQVPVRAAAVAAPAAPTAAAAAGPPTAPMAVAVQQLAVSAAEEVVSMPGLPLGLHAMLQQQPMTAGAAQSGTPAAAVPAAVASKKIRVKISQGPLQGSGQSGVQQAMAAAPSAEAATAAAATAAVVVGAPAAMAGPAAAGLPGQPMQAPQLQAQLPVLSSVQSDTADPADLRPSKRMRQDVQQPAAPQPQPQPAAVQPAAPPSLPPPAAVPAQQHMQPAHADTAGYQLQQQVHSQGPGQLAAQAATPAAGAARVMMPPLLDLSKPAATHAQHAAAVPAAAYAAVAPLQPEGLLAPATAAAGVQPQMAGMGGPAAPYNMMQQVAYGMPPPPPTAATAAGWSNSATPVTVVPQHQQAAQANVFMDLTGSSDASSDMDTDQYQPTAPITAHGLTNTQTPVSAAAHGDITSALGSVYQQPNRVVPTPVATQGAHGTGARRSSLGPSPPGVGATTGHFAANDNHMLEVPSAVGFVLYTQAVGGAQSGMLPGGHGLAHVSSPAPFGTQGSAGQPAGLGTHGLVGPHAAVPTQGLTRLHAGLGTQNAGEADDLDDLPSPPRYTVTTGDTCIPWDGGHQPSVLEQAKAYMRQREAQLYTQAQFDTGTHEAKPHSKRPRQKAGSDRQHRRAPSAAIPGHNRLGTQPPVHHGNMAQAPGPHAYMAQARVNHGHTHPGIPGPSGQKTAAPMDFQMSGLAAPGHMHAQPPHVGGGWDHAANTMPGAQNAHTMSTQHGMPQGILMPATPPSHVQGPIMQMEGSRQQAFFCDSPHGLMTVLSHMAGQGHMAAPSHMLATGYMAGYKDMPAPGNMAAGNMAEYNGMPAAGYMIGHNSMPQHPMGGYTQQGYKRGQDAAGLNNPQPHSQEEGEEGIIEQLMKKGRCQY